MQMSAWNSPIGGCKPSSSQSHLGPCASFTGEQNSPRPSQQPLSYQARVNPTPLTQTMWASEGLGVKLCRNWTLNSIKKNSPFWCLPPSPDRWRAAMYQRRQNCRVGLISHLGQFTSSAEGWSERSLCGRGLYGDRQDSALPSINAASLQNSAWSPTAVKRTSTAPADQAALPSWFHLLQHLEFCL